MVVNIHYMISDIWDFLLGTDIILCAPCHVICKCLADMMTFLSVCLWFIQIYIFKSA